MIADPLPDIQMFLEQSRKRCEVELAEALLHLSVMPPRLVEAMRYSTLLGGKRIRPALVYASAQALGDDSPSCDAAACAVELIHCYSLIHDDLPAMDNDDLRRGQPTLHKAFDEATAILAGDALQSLAFQVLADGTGIRPDVHVRMLALLARAAGCDGMIAGQGIDLEGVGKELRLSELETMHTLKTGALIRASVELGALCADAGEEELQMLRSYADCIGLAFQVQDDILDVTSDTGTLGKTQGADQARNKPTYVSLLGLEVAEHKTKLLIQQACDVLAPLGARAGTLQALALYIRSRRH
jgi:geranylgeranyl pyrophosphate synthase